MAYVSYVVNRWPLLHTLRRRIASPPGTERLSMMRLNSFLHSGHAILPLTVGFNSLLVAILCGVSFDLLGMNRLRFTLMAQGELLRLPKRGKFLALILGQRFPGLDNRADGLQKFAYPLILWIRLQGLDFVDGGFHSNLLSMSRIFESRSSADLKRYTPLSSPSSCHFLPSLISMQ